MKKSEFNRVVLLTPISTGLRLGGFVELTECDDGAHRSNQLNPNFNGV